MSHQTRREFLENSMLAAAAIAGSLAATPQFAEEPQSTSPNERLRVAVVGVNGRGGAHIHGFRSRKDCEIAAICDADEGVGQAKVAGIEKSTGKKPVFFTDIRKLLEDKSINIVSIATPNHWHALGAIWAIQAGKDVYVENPVSHNVSEGRRVVEAARKHNRICQTGTQCRSMPGTIEMMKYIHSGEIGEVNLAHALCYRPRPSIGPKGVYDVPAKVNYDLWSGPAPLHLPTRPRFHHDWHWQWDYGSGDLGNLGVHQMDVARWGLGLDDVGQGVMSYGGRFGYEDAGETANTQTCIHDYGNKTLVHEVRGLRSATELPKTANAGGIFYGTRFSDGGPAFAGVIFYGAKGYVVMNSYDGGFAFDLDGNPIKKFSGGAENLHFDNCVKAVRSRKFQDLNADILQGHLSSALCHLGNISYRLGQTASVSEAKDRLQSVKAKEDAVETFDRFTRHLAVNNIDLDKKKIVFGAALALDGKAETFTGNGGDNANPMLSRDYRKPFVVPAAEDV